MSSEPPKERLPFEPAKKTKKKPKAPPEPQVKAAEDTKQPLTSQASSMSIPDVVSKRMIRRMALLCGVPTAAGISTFIASYLVVSKGWLALPNSVVVLLSMGFFGLGVLGLSYGVLSASWDEENPGSIIGWEEFNTNFGRMRAAWRSAKPKS